MLPRAAAAASQEKNLKAAGGNLSTSIRVPGGDQSLKVKRVEKVIKDED